MWEGSVYLCRNPLLHSRLLPHPIPPLLFPPSLAGGFKLWEGSVDLCKSLCEVFKLDAELLSSGQTAGLLEVREGGGGQPGKGRSSGQTTGLQVLEIREGWNSWKGGVSGGGCQLLQSSNPANFNLRPPPRPPLPFPSG